MTRPLHEIDGIHELFETPPEGFVKARNALAKALKSQGEAEASAQVAKLKRPTGPVWAINQLARRHRDDVERFLEIQSSLAEIGGGRRLNELAGERRKVVGRLTQVAGKLLKADGQTATTQTFQRIGATLLAADDPEEQEAIRLGLLTHELEVSGFGGLSFSSDTSPEEEDTDKENERKRAEQEVEELEAAAAEAAERATRLDEEAAELLQQADAAASEAREARKQADRLATEAKAARAKLKRR